MVLLLHNRYRTAGGEERVVEDLAWLVREHLGEEAQVLARAPAPAGAGARAQAAVGLLRGGLHPDEVAQAVRLTGARVVHAHNLNPTLGWRALAAARGAGARVVVHLHQYRLVCAVGVCFTAGAECVRCHGSNTLPGVVRNCRGNRAEALAYGAGLALWQRRVAACADAVIVPSEFARERLRELGAPLPWERVHVVAPPVRALHGAPPPVSTGPPEGMPHTDGPASPRPPEGMPHTVAVSPAPSRPPEGYALVVARLSPEKGVDVAVQACRLAGVPLVVAGAGPAGAPPPADGEGVRYVGRVDDARLAELRAGAAVAVVPSRSAETFGLAAAEAMAAGLPVAASRVGALPELVGEEGLVPPGDAEALAAAVTRLRADPRAGERARARVAAVCAPQVVARKLAEVYGT